MAKSKQGGEPRRLMPTGGDSAAFATERFQIGAWPLDAEDATTRERFAALLYERIDGCALEGDVHDAGSGGGRTEAEALRSAARALVGYIDKQIAELRKERAAWARFAETHRAPRKHGR